MKSVLIFVSLAFAVGVTPIRNDRVVVFDETIRPGESVIWTGDHPSLLVPFTEGFLEFAGPPVRVSRGAPVFYTAERRALKNAGPSDVHYARIEFLGGGSPETWGAAGLSPNYKLILENRCARVYDIRIPAGTREPQHTHHDRVVICLSGAQLKHLMPDGREEPSTLTSGEIAWRRGGTHIGQNLGTTDLWVIAVEPK